MSSNVTCGCVGSCLNLFFRTDCFRYVFANCMKTSSGRNLDGAAWTAFLSDMDRLAEGIMPDGSDAYVDEDGVRWGGILNFGQGDLEQLCFHFGLKHYNDMDELCGFCRCNRTTLPYTNLQEHAEWRPTAPLSNDVDVYEIMASLID